MNSLTVFLVLAVAYGVVCGGVATWLSPRRRGTWAMMGRYTAIFTIVGLVLAWVCYIILK